jgi:hypothetical protein
LYSQCTIPARKRKALDAAGLVLGFGAMGDRKRILLLSLGFVALHLNYWMWDDGRIVLGLPANLLYHVVLSLVLSMVFFVLVHRAWPRYLDED